MPFIVKSKATNLYVSAFIDGRLDCTEDPGEAKVWEEKDRAYWSQRPGVEVVEVEEEKEREGES
jgi:hypothetical protein